MKEKTTIETILDKYTLKFDNVDVEIGLSELDGHKFMYENLIMNNKPLSYKRVYTMPEDNYKRLKQSWNDKFDMVQYGKK